ncbi:MAG: hypothetical protein AB7L09_00645 [Nitrospira sp.]
MDIILLLAQSTPDPEKTIGWLERILQGGVPLICLVIAVTACVAAVFQYRKNHALELDYRNDLANRAQQAKEDAEKRLAEAKQEAKERAAEIDKLMRERLSSEKESDATLAHAVHMIEASAKIMERLERKLEG